MFDANSQARFNKSCTDAFVNYLHASSAAYQAMADNMLKMWGQSVDAMVEGAQNAGASASRSRDVGFRGNVSTGAGRGAAACMMPWAAVPGAMMQSNPLASFNAFNMPYGMFSPFAPWLEMMKPFQSPAWPMAVGMISVGVPEQVAWPTARGNMAAMNAFNLAADSLEKAFKSYQEGQGGPATARATSGESARNGYVTRMESRDTANPFTVAFAISPFNPGLLMEFFAPYRPRG